MKIIQTKHFFAGHRIGNAVFSLAWWWLCTPVPNRTTDNVTNMRIWLVSADEEKCNHVAAFQKLRFISWVEASNAHMAVGDVVYVYMSDTKRLRYKTKVTRVHEIRQDTQFWLKDVENASQQITCRLELVADYGAAGGPTEQELRDHGLSKHALHHPKLLIYNSMDPVRRKLSRFIIDSTNELTNNR